MFINLQSFCIDCDKQTFSGSMTPTSSELDSNILNQYFDDPTGLTLDVSNTNTLN